MEKASALVGTYPQEIGLENNEELKVLTFDRRKAKTMAIAKLAGNNAPTKADQSLPTAKPCATGAAAQVYAVLYGS